MKRANRQDTKELVDTIIGQIQSLISDLDCLLKDLSIKDIIYNIYDINDYELYNYKYIRKLVSKKIKEEGIK